MAISEACKFEIKEEVDDMLERGDVETKSGAFDALVKFYKTIGIDIKKKTVESKYYRAPANGGNKSKTPENTEDTTPEFIKHRRPQGGGKREGAGRPRKEPDDDKPKWSGHGKYLAIIAISQLERIEADDPQRDEGFDMVISWIEKNR